MTKAELERLALLSEECGEVIAVIGKILRNGWDNADPTDSASPTNRQRLESEIGDVLFSIRLLTGSGDLSAQRINQALREARLRKQQWLRHQNV